MGRAGEEGPDVGVVIVASSGQVAAFSEHPGVFGGVGGECPADGGGERGRICRAGGVAGQRFGDGLGEPARGGGYDRCCSGGVCLEGYAAERLGAGWDDNAGQRGMAEQVADTGLNVVCKVTSRCPASIRCARCRW